MVISLLQPKKPFGKMCRSNYVAKSVYMNMLADFGSGIGWTEWVIASNNAWAIK